MANPTLDADQLKLAQKLVDEIRRKLLAVSGEDKNLLFAFRRKVFKTLLYDERRTPAARNKLKRQKRKEQEDNCAHCGEKLPDKYVVLDRFDAVQGYTEENTQLICQPCDRRIQEHRAYK
jgi:hypothetical protein